LDKFATEKRSQRKELAVWKRMNDRALSEKDPNEAEHLFFDAVGYAGSHLKPALNVERETSMLDWAELAVRHHLPDCDSLLNSADANASFNLPNSDPLRQRIGRLQAEILSRKQQDKNGATKTD
jgi:hypothetical protein